MTEGLSKDLRSLRDYGFIHAEAIRRIPPEAKNLSEFVQITPKGRKFLALMREALDEQEN